MDSFVQIRFGCVLPPDVGRPAPAALVLRLDRGTNVRRPGVSEHYRSFFLVPKTRQMIQIAWKGYLDLERSEMTYW